MFGIGGALLATPMLSLWLGLAPKIAVATPLPATIPSAVSGSIAYSRNRLVRFDVAWRLLVVALPATVAGAYLNDSAPDAVLLIATGLVLAYSAWTFIRKGLRRTETKVTERTALAFGGAAYAAGACAGFLSGLLAIGGGVVMVPALVRIVGLDTKESLATSLFCVAALAIPGTVVHALANHIDWHVALMLGIVVVPFSYAGARLATWMRTRTLELLYGTTMLAFAVYFIIRSI